ncbi:TetR family transcriptional regulator [Streptomyces sp. NPDC092295]|uniref:TetR family transcriptional regulator n=1 Tax=Streptomyces sp. NPDC092295 TaxID=3366011 RepID=UPI00381A3091
MVQERAERTRRAMVHAAAEEIDRGGYHGASLASISRSAGMSMGALTFHFPTKDRLVEAVQALSVSMVRETVEAVEAVEAMDAAGSVAGADAVDAPAGTDFPAGTDSVAGAASVRAPSLGRARELILAISRLLAGEPVVRAAVRLGWERPSREDWTASWLPRVGELLVQAHADGELRQDADPETVTALAAGLVQGLHCRMGAGADAHESLGQLTRILDVILRSLSAPGPGGPDTPRSSPGN